MFVEKQHRRGIARPAQAVLRIANGSRKGDYPGVAKVLRELPGGQRMPVAKPVLAHQHRDGPGARPARHDPRRIDYRLGMKRARQAGLLDEEHFTQALDMTLSMATEDLYDATAYICRHMPDVDPSRIVTCGSSAGAITVLMGEYWLCNGHPLTAGKFTQDFSYAGVIAFAGAVCDTQDSLRWARDPAPMLLFHEHILLFFTLITGFSSPVITAFSVVLPKRY
jgi:hypothetical protein